MFNYFRAWYQVISKKVKFEYNIISEQGYLFDQKKEKGGLIFLFFLMVRRLNISCLYISTHVLAHCFKIHSPDWFVKNKSKFNSFSPFWHLPLNSNWYFCFIELMYRKTNNLVLLKNSILAILLPCALKVHF